jgi:uncharacterized membrane protein
MLKKINKSTCMVFNAFVALSIFASSLMGAETRETSTCVVDFTKSLKKVDALLKKNKIEKARTQFVELINKPDFKTVSEGFTLNQTNDSNQKLFWEIFGKLSSNYALDMSKQIDAKAKNVLSQPSDNAKRPETAMDYMTNYLEFKFTLPQTQD